MFRRSHVPSREGIQEMYGVPCCKVLPPPPPTTSHRNTVSIKKEIIKQDELLSIDSGLALPIPQTKILPKSRRNAYTKKQYSSAKCHASSRTILQTGYRDTPYEVLTPLPEPPSPSPASKSPIQFSNLSDPSFVSELWHINRPSIEGSKVPIGQQ